MSLRVAREIIMQDEFDSGSVTPLCYLVHQVKEPGLYIGQVTHGKDVVGTFRVQAVGEGATVQVNIDLATVRGTLSGPNLMLAPGSIVLYSSVGSIGYSVKVWRSGGKRRKLEFDSQKLGADDLFAVTLLHPGDYTVAGGDDESLCRLSVSACKPGKKPYRPPAPTVAGLSDETIKDAKTLRLRQAQTQVFRADGRSRIKVRLADSFRAALKPPSGKIEWRRKEE